jgi:Maltokinase N-terminal cap domain
MVPWAWKRSSSGGHRACFHVPMTYRGAPLGGAEPHLIGTVHHSVLGKRWIYEAAGDPVALACFARALSGQQEQAILEIYDGDVLIARRDPVVRVRRRPGSACTAGGFRLAEVLGETLDGHDELVATWSGGDTTIA